MSHDRAQWACRRHQTLASGENRQSMSRVEATGRGCFARQHEHRRRPRAASRLVDVYDLASMLLRLAFDASLDGQARQ